AVGFAERDRLAVADEREFANLDLEALLPGRRLGEPDARHLRPTISAAGDVLRIGGVRADVLVAQLLRDRFGRGDAFVTGLVREPRRSGDVADRPDAGHAGAAIFVDVNVALGRFDAECLQA